VRTQRGYDSRDFKAEPLTPQANISFNQVFADIDENEIVFLPKGYYRVTDTLRLKPNTKLVGVAHHLSTIMTRAPYGALEEGDGPEPLVETADTADADTILAFIGILIAPEVLFVSHFPIFTSFRDSDFLTGK
jgi:hypothetical protein